MQDTVEKVSSYITQYPDHSIAQSALHLTPWQTISTTYYIVRARES